VLLGHHVHCSGAATVCRKAEDVSKEKDPLNFIQSNGEEIDMFWPCAELENTPKTSDRHTL
jgi:hypothetical protein